MKTWIAAILLFALPALGQSSITVSQLLCEYKQDPLGIDTPAPRLAWKLTSPQKNQAQTAYHILVATTPSLLDENKADLWDSGKVSTSQSIQMPYAGSPLASHTACYWKVRVWDQDGQPSAWSPTGRWTMGYLSPQDWQAEWITLPQEPMAPLPLFRKEFAITKPVRHAIVSICGLGFYELRLNGDKVGDNLFDPGWSAYRRTCLYTTYDITASLQPRNAFGVMLGNGFFNVTGGRYVKYTGSLGAPQLILQLHIQYEDGTTEALVTDSSWRATPGPIQFTCIYGGEDYDATTEQPGWDRPGFDDPAWQPVTVCAGPGGALVAQPALPIQKIQDLQPVGVTQPKPGVFVYDLGQNASGIPWIHIRGPKGKAVKITPAELIHEDGTVNQSASGGPHNYTYTLKGEGAEIWAPRFTYYGFRYIQIEGAVPLDLAKDGEVALIGCKGLFTRYSASRVGQFQCSDEPYNQVFRLVDWAVGSNLQSVLTDCPHREKLGWLEVSHLMAPSILFTYDTPAFYTKVLRDIRDSQLENGLIPDIAPEYTVFSGGFRDSPEWGSAGVILPWLLYEWFGDKEALAAQYETMKKYTAYLASTATGHLVSHGLGDWFDYVRGGSVGPSQLTPTGITATGFYYHNLTILRDTARILGKTHDADTFAAQAETVRQAFNTAFFDTRSHNYATGSQTANALPLVFGMEEPEQTAKIIENLVNEVQTRGYLTAGDVGFRFLLRALATAGRNDLIYTLTHQTGEPGYLFQIAQGATSLTEAWDGREVVSHNHCMLGHIVEWFYQDLAGIRRDPADLAFKKIIIQPNPVGEIASARASFDSPYGLIQSEWQRDGLWFTLAIEIPVNTQATVVLPNTDPAQLFQDGQPVGPDGLEIHPAASRVSLKVNSGRTVFRSAFQRQSQKQDE
ncbi:MAG: glycoside hydrolase family 78 protein [bacterium]|jgi:hypothetical protein|nr:glycoside hydrolase family 78 protein [bacterium]